MTAEENEELEALNEKYKNRRMIPLGTEKQVTEAVEWERRIFLSGKKEEALDVRP